MKRCLKCYKTYSDDSLNFCLDDGEILVANVPDEFAGSRTDDDSPPTMVMDNSRVTNPTDWPTASPIAAPVASWQPQGMQNPQFQAFSYAQKQDKTFPTIALILGILSIVVSCCYGGFWLGLPAAVLGFMGMRNADNDPTRYGGRGMAIAGMVLGAVSFLITLVIVFAAIFSR